MLTCSMLSLIISFEIFTTLWVSKVPSTGVRAPFFCINVKRLSDPFLKGAHRSKIACICKISVSVF